MDYNNQNTPENSNRSFLKTAGIVVVFFVIGYVLYGLISQSEDPVATQGDKVVGVTQSVERGEQYISTNREEVLAGTLQMTLLNTEQYASDPEVPDLISPVSLYEYSFSTKVLSEVPDTDFHDTKSVRDSDGAIVYAATSPKISYENFVGYENIKPTIYFEDEHGEQHIFDVPELFGNFVIEKRNPHLANTSNKIVYSAQINLRNNDILPVGNLDNWYAVIADPETGTEEVLTEGAHAVWSKDDRYVFLVRHDGVYAYDTSAEDVLLASTRIVNSVDGFWYGNQFQISDNGQYITLNQNITSPGEVDSRVEVYELNFEGSQPTADRVTTLLIENSMTFWPTLSPEGRYVAFQLAETRDRINTRISIYDIENDIIVEEFSLEDYNFDYAFLTDWSMR